MSISADRILYQDDHFLAVNKLSGELVVRGKGEVGKLPLLDFLRKEEPGLRPINRLDFETSGVVLFARTKEAAQAVLTSLRGHDAEGVAMDDLPWKKTYRTLVAGRITRAGGDIQLKLPARSGKGAVEAHTSYRVLKRFANSTYVEAQIATGRYHQIRRHFGLIGHPLVLDHVYGNRPFNHVFTQEFGYRRFFLHAFSLTLKHPFEDKEVTVEAALPRPFLEVIKRLSALS